MVSGLLFLVSNKPQTINNKIIKQQTTNNN